MGQPLIRSILLLTAFVVATAVVPLIGHAQSDQKAPAFEVASVKPNRSGGTPMRFGLPPGRFIITNAPLRAIIVAAYQLSDFQVLDVPEWAASERFDIEALTKQADGGPLTLGAGGPPPQLFLMLRSLLAERFKLAAHTEMREMPVYSLVLARKEKSLGPAIAPTTIDCAALAAAAIANPSAPPRPSRPGQPPKCGMFGATGRFEGWAATMSEFGQMLSQMMGRTVIDQTGLVQRFDFKLTFTPQQIPQDPSATASLPLEPAIPFAAALEEQLGLKLQSTKAPVDVLVIDHVEKPTPD